MSVDKICILCNKVIPGMKKRKHPTHCSGHSEQEWIEADFNSVPFYEPDNV